MTLYVNGKPLGYCNEIEESIVPIKDAPMERIRIKELECEFTLPVSIHQEFIIRLMADRLAWQMAKLKMCSIL